MGNTWCGKNFCCDCTEKRVADYENPDTKAGRLNAKGEYDPEGNAQLKQYVNEYDVKPNQGIQGSCASDMDLSDFVREHIDRTVYVECIVVISPKTASAYTLPDKEITQTGAMMLAELIRSNKEYLRIFHLNGQRLDQDRAPAIVEALRECQKLELIDLYDCHLDRDACSFIFNNLKDLPCMKEMILSGNDVNAKTRTQIGDIVERDYKGKLQVVF